jgi:hypothetical protein
MLWRWLLPLLLAAGPAVSSAASAADPQVLFSVGDDVATVNHALLAISQGDSAPLEALSPAFFSKPIGRPDQGYPDIIRRWTLFVPRALADLSDEPRERILQALDKSFLAGSAKLDADQVLCMALDFLPAPSARKAVKQASSQAFDLGDFRKYLALDALLGNPAEARKPIAQRLLAKGAEIDPSIELSAPGALVTTAANGRPDNDGITVQWRRVPGFLCACDPCGRALWQYAIEPNAETVFGPYAAVVAGRRGLRIAREDGTVSLLPTMPGAARVLCVAGGAVWFSDQTSAFRYDLTDGDITVMTLPTAPIGPPIVRGSRSMWLGERELFLFERGQLIHRFVHGQQAANEWRLLLDGGRVILSGGVGNYAFEPFDAQLEKAQPLERMRLYARASLYADALKAFQSDAALQALPEARQLALQSRLAQQDFAKAEDCETLLDLVDSPQAELMVLYQIHWYLDKQAIHDSNLAAARIKLLQSAAKATVMEVPRDPREFIAGHSCWTQALTGAGIQRWLSWPTNLGWPAQGDAKQPVENRFEEAPVIVDSAVRNDGATYHYRGLSLRIESQPGVTSVKAVDGASGAPLWHVRWESPIQFDAPSRNVVFSGDHILIGEGRSRITTVDIRCGDTARVRFTGADAVGTDLMLLDQTPNRRLIALLGPRGKPDELWLIDSAGKTQHERLPSTARWIAKAPGNALLVQLENETLLCRWQQDTVRVTLPAAVRDGPSAEDTSDGLISGHRLYRWRQ